MCLLIGNREGHVLKKDLICFKQIIGNDSEGYKTPCQDWPVTLDSTLEPDEKSPVIEECGFKYQIGAGVIHAYLKVQTEEDNYYKAIIPAGTKFWLQDDLQQVAAEKLILTSEKVKGNPVSDLTELFISAAEVCMKDGTRKSITESPNPKDIIGIYTSTGKIVSINLHTEYTKFSENRLTGYPTEKMISEYEDAFKDMDGQENTDTLKKTCKESKLLAIGKLKDGEYLPSQGELKEAFIELEAINLTREYLGLELIPFAWFWSSSIRDDESIWICDSIGRYLWYRWRYCSWAAAVFFLSYPALLKIKDENLLSRICKTAKLWLKHIKN